jgi:hypothetical protein
MSDSQDLEQWQPAIIQFMDMACVGPPARIDLIELWNSRIGQRIRIRPVVPDIVVLNAYCCNSKNYLQLHDEDATKVFSGRRESNNFIICEHCISTD